MTQEQNPQEPSASAPLVVDAVRARLAAAGHVGRILHVARCGSTNAQAAELDLGGAGGSTWALVVAEEQTAGRGRLSRSWQSAAGTGLLFSLALSAPASPPHLSLLPLLAGLAVAQQSAARGVPARVKWPNDIVVIRSDGAIGKLGGVLLERTADAVIVGVGLNVLAAPGAHEAPEGAALVEYGLVAAEGIREALLADCTAAILSTWQALRGDEQQPLVEAYRSACATLGSQVRAALPDGSHIVGEAVDIDSTGRLLVVPDIGDHDPPMSGVVALSAADIVHLRTV